MCSFNMHADQIRRNTFFAQYQTILLNQDNFEITSNEEQNTTLFVIVYIHHYFN